MVVYIRHMLAFVSAEMAAAGFRRDPPLVCCGLAAAWASDVGETARGRTPQRCPGRGARSPGADACIPNPYASDDSVIPVG